MRHLTCTPQPSRREWNRKFSALPEARMIAFGPPPLPGYGNVSGFTLQLQNRSGGSVDQLAAQVRQFLAEAAKRPELGRLSTTFEPVTPQVSVELDREKARTLGVKVDSLRDTTGLFERALCERHRPLRARV